MIQLDKVAKYHMGWVARGVSGAQSRDHFLRELRQSEVSRFRMRAKVQSVYWTNRWLRFLRAVSTYARLVTRQPRCLGADLQRLERVLLKW